MKVEDLKNETKFRLVHAMPLEELKPFVIENIKHKNKFTIFYNFLIYSFLIGVIGVIVLFLPENKAELRKMVMYFGIGIAMSFTVLIFLHELIHGLAYKIVGATKVTYGGNIWQFVFYAAADKFIANRASFIKVALAPFVVITLIGIVTFLLGDVYYKWLATGMLMGHTTLCGGDFAMLSFFEKNKEKEMLTYDDMENKVMYFFEKI